MIESKIKSLEELSKIVEDLKKQGKKIVHCHGVFDLIHYGHIMHFIASKKQGDVLVVTLTPDIYVKKGPERPFFNQDIRLRHVAALECVDYVALNKWETAVETIKILKPDVYSKGKEVLNNEKIDEVQNEGRIQSNLSTEIEALTSFGGKLHLTDEVTFSSSKIINQITAAIPEESKEFLKNFKKKYNIQDLLEILESLKDLRVLVIGDAILDEYIYCDSMGVSGKGTLISYKYLNSDIHLGGVFVIANTISNFTKNVAVITCIGDNSYDFINKNLSKSIETNIFIEHNKRTLVKTRYVDNYRKYKLFEIYNVGGLEIEKETEEKIIDCLKKVISRFDLVLIADFGHGLLSKNVRDFLTDSEKFLAINCQINGGNRGYNFITKYKRADFVSLNESELRFPFQEKDSDIVVPILKLKKELNVNKINVTLGKFGSAYYSEDNIYRVHSFTQEIVDTIGAGDAVLALTSMLSYKNIDPILVPFFGNCIGALAVKIMGNIRTVDSTELKKFVSYIMK
ncbi:MAG: PfkB family carbohydrate kinase [Candidatus Pacearchaeota archaeon]